MSRETRSILIACLVASLLTAGALACPCPAQAEVDPETAALEAQALCHAQPYRCPPNALMTPAERTQDHLCDGLTPHLVLIASKRAHHEPLDAADQAAASTWAASCLDWQEKRRLRAPQQSPPPAAFVVPAPPRITTDCWTDAWWGVYHSTISTTCTTR